MKKRIVSVSLALVIIVAMVGVSSAQGGLPGTGWWTGEAVQNVGVATATIMVTAYTAADATSFASSQTVASFAAVTFMPTSFASMPPGFIGSAVVSSDQPIKAIVNVTNNKSGDLGVTGGKAAAQYQGTESAGTSLYFPLVKNSRFTKTTAFYIQNAGTVAASVTAVFKMDTGTPGVYTKTIASVDPNKMVLISPSDAGVPIVNGTGGRDNIGGLTVSSAQPLAGTVLEYIQGEPIATLLSGTRGFTAADFDTKVYAPVVKNNRFNKFTGIQVQNVSSGPVDITINYVGTVAGCLSAYTETATGVAAGASKTFVQSGTPVAGGFPVNCSGTATIVATGNIVAIVNEGNLVVSAANPAAGTTYSAMPSKSTTMKVSAPLFKDQRYGYSTGLAIQNVGSASASVVATFACGTFTAVSLPQTIAIGGGKTFLKPSAMTGTFTSANPFSASGVACGVQITSDQPIVAIANEAADVAGTRDANNYEGFNLAP